MRRSGALVALAGVSALVLGTGADANPPGTASVPSHIRSSERGQFRNIPLAPRTPRVINLPVATLRPVKDHNT